MGDVISIGTKQVVQPEQEPELEAAMGRHPSGQNLMWDGDQVAEFTALVDDLNYADTSATQQFVIDRIRQAVEAWPR
jgi:hypothetical protein